MFSTSLTICGIDYVRRSPKQERKSFDMSTPVTSLDQRYSAPNASATSWDDTRQELEKAELFWLTTVRADGRPHMTPLVAAWALDQLHFTTGDDEQKAKNLIANTHVILSTGRNDWQEGVDIVVEGEARRENDQASLEEIAKAFATKWDGDWKYEARDGKFFHPDGMEVQIFSVAPQTVYAFAKGTFGHTVHRFGDV
jgi:general stress protein 26